MSVLQDYYNTGDDSSISVNTNNRYYGESFTANQNYDITSVKFLCTRIGTPGNITITLVATSAGLPTDTLASVTVASSVVAEGSPAWVKFTFDSSYSLISGTKYGVYMQCATADSSNRISLQRDVSSPTYTGGILIASTDGGNSWAEVSGQDMLFETYSGVIAEGTKTVTASAIVSLVSENYASNQGVVPDRPSDYNSNLYWDEDAGAWGNTRTIHPGNWVQQMLAISEEGDIYFRTL